MVVNDPEVSSLDWEVVGSFESDEQVVKVAEEDDWVLLMGQHEHKLGKPLNIYTKKLSSIKIGNFVVYVIANWKLIEWWIV